MRRASQWTAAWNALDVERALAHFDNWCRGIALFCSQQQDRPFLAVSEAFMFSIRPIGHVRSPLTLREHAPKQGNEGAPEAWLVFQEEFWPGLSDLRRGDELLVLTWLHEADRKTLKVHPRDDARAPPTGVFSTRSQDRPNPIGVHRVRILDIEGLEFRVTDLEAFDATPIIDIKPVLDRVVER
jgi:tRNA-Thr(GGU) m(6)t(6)A37 methyltransferase TsaA